MVMSGVAIRDDLHGHALCIENMLDPSPYTPHMSRRNKGRMPGGLNILTS